MSVSLLQGGLLAQRCLPHPRSNTTVWFGRGHSAVQTTVCCWGGSRTGGLRGRENEAVLGRPPLPRAGREKVSKAANMAPKNGWGKRNQGEDLGRQLEGEGPTGSQYNKTGALFPL